MKGDSREVKGKAGVHGGVCGRGVRRGAWEEYCICYSICTKIFWFICCMISSGHAENNFTMLVYHSFSSFS